MKKIYISLFPIILLANINVNDFKDINLDKKYDNKMKLLDKTNMKSKIGDFNNIVNINDIIPNTKIDIA